MFLCLQHNNNDLATSKSSFDRVSNLIDSGDLLSKIVLTAKLHAKELFFALIKDYYPLLIA